MTLPALLLAAGLSMAPADTVVVARPGDRLVVRGFQGVVTVIGWERSEVRAAAEDQENGAVTIVRQGDELHVGWVGRGRRRGEDLDVRVPAWMNLDLEGRDLDVEIVGTTGGVTVRTMEGDLSFRNLDGEIGAYTADGEIEGRGLSASARLESGDGDITLVSCAGALELETVDGDMDLRQMRASHIRARTTDGDVDFSGVLLPGGEYGFYSHGGDVTLRLEEPVDLNARVLTYDGELESDFPIRAGGYRSGEALAFTIGSGGAALTVESFSGEVLLIRAGAQGKTDG